MCSSNLFGEIEDTETKKILEIVLWNLQMYFHCKTKEAGAELINRFYSDSPDYFKEYFHFHDTPFRVASRIYWEYIIEGEKSEFVNWLRENDIFDPPEGSMEYFNRNYWRKL